MKLKQIYVILFPLFESTNHNEHIIQQHPDAAQISSPCTAYHRSCRFYRLETLLKLYQQVVGLDNFFSTEFQHNLDEVRSLVDSGQWQRSTFIEDDICNLNTCKHACGNVDYVLHQTAPGSVPRSIKAPLTTNENNISGFLNMLVAARDTEVKRYAPEFSMKNVLDMAVKWYLAKS